MTLTTTETADLLRLESIVDRGKQTFLEVGAALKEIRDRKLHRLTDKTFAEYVEDRFELKKSYAYDLIASAEVVADVQHAGRIENPRQAVELAKASPEKRGEVLDRAEEIAEERGTRPTAKIIAEARSEIDEEEPLTHPQHVVPTRKVKAEELPKRGDDLSDYEQFVEIWERAELMTRHAIRVFVEEHR